MQAVSSFSDTELVANLRAGKKVNSSIQALYRDHWSSLCWYVMNNGGSRQDAEDIFQEVIVTFIDIVEKDRFRGEATIRTFLFALNRHAWLNELKKRGRTLVREEKYEHQQDRVTTDAGALIVDLESKQQVMDLLDRLGDTCKKILVLFYYENLSIADILRSLNYQNEQVVRNKKYKCLKEIEQMIAKDPELKKTLKNLLNG